MVMEIFILVSVYTVGIGIIGMFLKSTVEDFSLWLKSHTSKERKRLRDELREELYLEAVKKIYDKEAYHLDQISKLSEKISNLNIENQKLKIDNLGYKEMIDRYSVIGTVRIKDLIEHHSLYRKYRDKMPQD